MDLLFREAPLDSSFQKDRRELASKGSLGRRRKPTRSNLKNLLSPAQNTPPLSSNPKAPTCAAHRIVTNGYCRLTNGNSYTVRKAPHVSKTSLKTESSLPRINRESSHVADAQQFTIEAKLKRKKSDTSGRSAVLIQTWERRTRTDSLPKRREQHPSGPKAHNRFQNKENLLQNCSDMRDFTNHQRCLGSYQNGEALKERKTIRDGHSQNGHLTNMPVRNSNHVTSVPMNGTTKPSKHQEPEWISLSRKLCAKYVGENVEHNSADSYPNEEPDGVKQLQQGMTKSCPPQTTSGPPKRVEKKKVMVDHAPMPKAKRSGASEPPWIPLSRKLCTKFIEEHIEYPRVPPVIKEASKKPRDLTLEVRPIEKIGKPKGRKSRDEPEWVSLSRKLRAKFIESHKDDPDTISLENQLNASDPEETSSESLSDISQEIGITMEVHETRRGPANKDWKPTSNGHTNNFGAHKKNLQPNRFQTTPCPDPISPQNEEDCWEFQEVEFGQESDSGPQQESEISTPLPNSTKLIDKSKKYEGFLPNRTYVNTNSNNFTSFAESASAQMVHKVEFYSNDVNFSPRVVNSDKAPNVNTEKKGITIQFVSNRGLSPGSSDSIPEMKQDRSPERINNNSPFFNLTTWEEAHYKSDEVLPERNSSPSFATLRDEFRSKSVENISKNDDHRTKRSNCDAKENLLTVKNTMHSKWNPIYKSENCLDKLESETPVESGTKNRSFEDDNLHTYHTIADNVHITEVYRNGKEVSIKSVVNGSTKDLNGYMMNRDEPESMSDSDFVFNESKTADLNRCKTVEPNPSTCENHLVFTRNTDQSEQSKHFRSVGCDTSFPDENFTENDKIRINCNGQFTRQETTEPDGNLTLYGHINGSDEKSLKSLPKSSKNQIGFKCWDTGKKQARSEISQKTFNGSSTANNQNNDQKLTGMKKHYKCNGVISNSKMHQVRLQPGEYSNDLKMKEKIVLEPQFCNNNKEKKVLISEKANSTNEYANLPSPFIDNGKEQDLNKLKNRCKSFLSVNDDASDSFQERDDAIRRNSFDERPLNSVNSSKCSIKENASSNASFQKSKSFNDVSRNEENTGNEKQSTHSEQKQSSFSRMTVGSEKTKSASTIKFQEFACVEDIPLCAKLVSKQNGRKSTSSVSSSNRNPSPYSESSHVYEDMFKEKSSCPSDSETSSWTTMKNNSYYINGRSCSMNELDLSDSCSMSVKCDYASSGSEQSTLQSRRSSCNSSSFYVNLRDYDSHMLEPKKKKDNRKTKSNGNLSNNSPPTPESLRHLFTSPFNGIHSPANRTSRVLTQLNQEPESHYYSTATATSSAFKHGFDPTPPKPKKTERSSSIKIKDIAHGIILTFKKFQNHSKASATHYVDVSHLAENGSKSKNSELAKFKPEKEKKKKHWGFSSDNGINDSDSGCNLSPKDIPRDKPKRSSSDLSGGVRPNIEISNGDLPVNVFEPEKKKGKAGKKKSNARDKGKKKRSKSMDSRAVPTVSRKVQQMADGTLYLVTTVSGDTAVPGVYSDSPDTSSEISSHKPIKLTGESNC